MRALVIACLLVCSPALAQVLPPSELPSWRTERTRLFFATTLDAGAFVRARLALGYGRPHWTWGGVEAEGFSSTQFAATWLRARLALVVADVAIAWRHTWAYQHTWLPEAESYSRLEFPRTQRASYDSLDLWAWGLAPAPFGYLDWELEAVRAYDIPARHAVFEEYLRAVMHPGWAVAARFAYAVTFASERGSAGAMVDAVWPARDGEFVLRVGPAFTWVFRRELDVATVLTFVVHSPDSLEVLDGVWGTLRLRYRWATGTRSPEKGQRALQRMLTPG